MDIGLLITGPLRPALAPRYPSYATLFEALLAPHGLRLTPYDVPSGQMPDSPEAHEGWLISGSKHGTYDPLPWIPPLEDFLRATYAADRPIVGICFGHQILAQALGGQSGKFDGGWALGRQRYEMADGSTRQMIAWHQDQVTTPPAEARCVGRSDFCENAFLLYGRRAYTMQPHPEFDTAFSEALLDVAQNDLPPDLVAQARPGLRAPLDTDSTGAQIARFFTTRAL